MTQLPPAEVTHHPAGDTAANPRLGDFLLTGIEGIGLVSWAIKTGSWLRRCEAPYRRFSHAALVIAEDGTLAEALARGVQRSPLSKYEPTNYVLVPHFCGRTRRRAGARVRGGCARGQDAIRLRDHLRTRALLLGGQLCIQEAGTAICSGFVSDALTRAGTPGPGRPSQ